MVTRPARFVTVCAVTVNTNTTWKRKTAYRIVKLELISSRNKLFQTHIGFHLCRPSGFLMKNCRLGDHVPDPGDLVFVLGTEGLQVCQHSAIER